MSIDSVEVELASITAAVSILGNECESGMATEAGQATWTGIKVILGWTNNPLVAEIPQRAASIITTSPDIKDKILELLKAGKTGTATDIAWTIKTVRDSRMLFAPLNHESYQRRCESIVPSIYLTLISIIEGVALGLLAQQLLTFSPHDGKDHVEQLLARIPYAGITFASLIIVTYEYIVLALVHRYAYELRDTVIVLGLGFCQIIPIFFLREPAWWWLGNALFCAAGACAFVNEAMRNSKSSFGVESIYPATQSKLLLDIWLAMLGTLWCLIASYLFFRSTPGIVRPGLLLIPMLLVQCAILYRERKYIRLIHEQLGFRWDE